MTAQQPSSEARAVAAFEATHGRPSAVASAPGRVNLIGEHTDYNDGFVLPMALPFRTSIAASPAPPGAGVEVSSEGYGTARFDPADPLTGHADWSLHLRGVHEILRNEGLTVPPWRGTIATDIPMGASLSSSAALEVACLSLLLAFCDTTWDPVAIARAGQRVENDVLGLPSGIMDQLISATAHAGHASLIDCRSLRATHHRLPDEAAVVVMDTGTRRELVDSEYAARRASCEAAARSLGIPTLRDAQPAQVAALPERSDAGPLRARAQHVLTENVRTTAAAAAMESGDPTLLGRLMNESHTSLRDDYQVSGPALDAIVSIAQDADGCYGARMTGGGFAGCAVALVDRAKVTAFVAHVEATYRRAQTIRPTLWVVEPGPGALVTHED